MRINKKHGIIFFILYVSLFSILLSNSFTAERDLTVLLLFFTVISILDWFTDFKEIVKNKPVILFFILNFFPIIFLMILENYSGEKLEPIINNEIEKTIECTKTHSCEIQIEKHQTKSSCAYLLFRGFIFKYYFENQNLCVKFYSGKQNNKSYCSGYSIEK